MYTLLVYVQGGIELSRLSARRIYLVTKLLVAICMNVSLSIYDRSLKAIEGLKSLRMSNIMWGIIYRIVAKFVYAGDKDAF